MKQISLYEDAIHEAVNEINKMLRQIDAECMDLHTITEKQKRSYLDSVRMLVNFLDHKDEYTRGHCERVTKYAVMLGQALEMGERDILNLELAALLHDIGKLAVPDEIINKEGRLTVQEYEIIKMHPAVGYELLKDISFLEVSKKVLLQHHERIDGKGYPQGLNDPQINIMSKILSIADAYDAMTSSRPYRKEGLSKENAIGQLELSKGSQFDTEIVDVFIRLIQTGEVA